MSGREPLSVAVITFNEERNLGRCLRSVDWADEIVVVDCGSTDRTREIAERHGANVLHHDWSGFVEQKNFAIERTRHDWVLSLDADEWLTQAGAGELRAVLGAPRADAYAFRRLTAFAGAFVRYVWSPDWQTRLFRKGHARFAGGQVHESLRLRDGARPARLGEPLMHLGYRSIGQYVDRMNRYTVLAAATLAEQGRRTSLGRMLFAPPATFVKLYLVKLGFRDGVRGLVIAAGSAFYVLLKYAKLWELQGRAVSGFEETVGVTDEDPDPTSQP